MKLLNKLNGWQRIWLLATILMQVAFLFQSWSVRFNPNQAFFLDKGWTTTDIWLYNLKTYFFEFIHLVIISAVLYTILHILVLLLRWALRGFKKEN